MKLAIQTMSVMIQTIIGVLILLGKADLRTLGWYFVITGAIAVFALLVAGVAKINEEKN